MIDIGYKLRDMRPEDTDFVFDSFYRSFRYAKRTEGEDLSYDDICPLWEENKPSPDGGLRVLIACDEADENNILGYVAHDTKALFYIYVKYTYRRLGVASNLLDKAELGDEFDCFVFQNCL